MQTCRDFSGIATTDYTFDTNGRLVKESFSGIDCLGGRTRTTEEYLAYSYSGNNLYYDKRQSTTRTLNQTFKLDSSNRISSIVINETGGGVYALTYSYDSTGNLSNSSNSYLFFSPSYIYMYDASNQLIRMEATTANGIVDTSGEYIFTYNSSGKISSTIYRGSSDSTNKTATMSY